MRKLILFIAITLSSYYVKAQYNFDFGVNLGASSFLGELGGPDEQPRNNFLDMNLQSTRYAFGGFARYRFAKNFAGKVSLNYLRVSGADSLTDEPTKRARNLSFRSDIFEASTTLEYYFITINDINRTGRYRSDFRAYVFGGVSAFYFKPEAEYQGNWYDLRTLRTEGQEEEYEKIAFAIPFGAGFYFTVKRNIRLGMEIGYRASFTDYIDDVSTTYAAPENLPFAESILLANRTQERRAIEGDEKFPNAGFYQQGSRRGNPNSNDGYMLAQFSVSYAIRGRSNFYKARYNSVINKRRKRTKF
jgi:hypothetical protein